jgi:hypothetical protein
MRRQMDPPEPDSRGEKARGKPALSSRDARLKAALKANMARRKAQAKARGAADAPGTIEDKD